jgi:DNA-binding transcriptional ArsR family regulator
VDQIPIDGPLAFFKALADESRLKIIGLLSVEEHSVRELAALLKLREPTVSHHLAILRALALVRLRADGNVHWYRLNEEELRRIQRLALSADNLARLSKTVQSLAWDENVLANFVEGECLKEIPVSRKKRRVILGWLASRFESGATYSEAEVNRILKRHHPDSATLRREMVGYRMLQRERGLYRRLP